MRLLDELWECSPSSLEPELLLWAALRRTSGPRLWWGAAQRQRGIDMLRWALRDGRLPDAKAAAALELLTALDAVQGMQRAGSTICREMHALQSHIEAWHASGVPGTEGVGWERPSAASSAPPHIRKMSRRYDALRQQLLQQARGAGTADALEPVQEGEEGEGEQLRQQREEEAAAAELPPPAGAVLSAAGAAGAAPADTPPAAAEAPHRVPSYAHTPAAASCEAPAAAVEPPRPRRSAPDSSWIRRRQLADGDDDDIVIQIM